jgi:hypothetical protein
MLPKVFDVDIGILVRLYLRNETTIGNMMRERRIFVCG